MSSMLDYEMYPRCNEVMRQLEEMKRFTKEIYACEIYRVASEMELKQRLKKAFPNSAIAKCTTHIRCRTVFQVDVIYVVLLVLS